MLHHPLGRTPGSVFPTVLDADHADEAGAVFAGEDRLPRGEATAVERGHALGMTIAASPSHRAIIIGQLWHDVVEQGFSQPFGDGFGDDKEGSPYRVTDPVVGGAVQAQALVRSVPLP